MFKILKNHKKSQVQTILLCGIAATLMFKLNLSNLLIIVATVYNVFFFSKTNIHKVKSFVFIFPLVFFIITVLSGFLSKNGDEGLRSVDLYLMPILICLTLINSDINRKTFLKVFNTFFLGSVLSATILLINVLVKIIKQKETQEIIFHDFTMLYDQHPVYYAVLLSVAIFYICFTKECRLHKSIKWIGITILIISLILCASKIVLFVNVVAYFILFSVNIKNRNQKIVYLSGFLFLAIMIYNIPFIKDRFVDGLRFHETTLKFEPTNNFKKKKLFDYTEKSIISDLELRYILWNIGVYHLVEDGKLLRGYGQGDVQDYLDYYYYSYNLAPNWNEGRNIHNQYLHILITHGLIIFLLFIAYILYSFFIAIKNKDMLFLFFITLIAIVFIFEVVLVRNMGINLFYFLNTLFLIKNIYFENSHFRNQGNTKLSWRV